MLKKIALFLLIVSLWSCEKKESMEFVGESFTENGLELCQGKECPSITVNYIKAVGNHPAVDNINGKIEDYVIGVFTMMDVSTMPDSIEDAAVGFVNGYFEDVALFPDSSMGYEAEVAVEVLNTFPGVISFQLFNYLYTGGAHGYAATTFLNVNPENGEEYTVEELFENYADFVAFAETRFREKMDIPEGQSINDDRFWFEDEKFYLPESMGFVDDKIIFVFNQYDIASYADGPIDLTISLDEAKPFLKDFIFKDSL